MKMTVQVYKVSGVMLKNSPQSECTRVFQELFPVDLVHIKE